jgi:hypothetical protein
MTKVKVLTSYLLDEEPSFNGTYLKSIEVFKNIGARKDRLEKFIEKNIISLN